MSETIQDIRANALRIASGLTYYDDEGRMAPLLPKDMVSAAEVFANFIADGARSALSETPT